MASNLLTVELWEKLAEDPFRGLRAGPANFSPFHFCRWWPGTPTVLQTPPKHPEYRTPQRCAQSKKKRNNPGQSCRFDDGEFLRTKEYGSSWIVDLAAARLRVTRGIILQGQSEHNCQPEKAGDDDQLRTLRTVFAVHEEQNDQ